MTKQHGFQHSDSWIFLSIAFYQDRAGTSLRDLIATADYIDRAIPTDEEIEGGISRLAGAGFVTVEDDHFYLTAAGRLVLREFHNKHLPLPKIWELLEQHLQSLELPEIEVAAFKLKAGQSQAAYDSYRELILDRQERPDRKKKLAD